MTKRLLLIFILLGLGIYLGVLLHNKGKTPSSRPVAKEAKPAPDFDLKDVSGQPLRLADYKGKVVLLDFWATWCYPCRSEIPEFVRWQKQYGPDGLQVIGISMDDDAKPVPDFMQKFQINYPVAMGDTKLADAYGGILGLPVNFLIGRDGKIYQKYVGLTNLPAAEEQVKNLLQSKQ